MARQAGKTFLAEAIGTFGLIFFGAGAVLHNAPDGALGMTGVALAYGLAVTLGMLALGGVSGAHFNPAVSFAMALTRRLSWGAMLRYWIAQLLGAAAAAWALGVAFAGGPLDAHLGTPLLDPGVGPLKGAVVEGILAFFLVLVFVATTVDPRAPKGFAGLAVGLTVTAGVLACGALTGGAMNPARAFGPAFVSGYWQDHWVYWAGPAVGGAVAAFVYDRLFLERG